MGTSTAWRAPATRLWRLARGAATRYLGPEETAAVGAGEVVARYVTALGGGAAPDGAEGALAALRLTRKVAQNLGAFVQTALSRDLAAALKDSGFLEGAALPPEVAAQALASAWLQPAERGLEATVVRVALVSVLQEALAAAPISALQGSSPPELARLVQRFLAEVLYHHLLFDLGESLEAGAPDLSLLDGGLAGIWARIEASAPGTGAEVSAPEDWRGLSGWLWITRLLELMLASLAGHMQKEVP